MKNQKKNQSPDGLTNYAKFSGMAFQMVAVIGLSVWAGISLDSYLKFKFPVSSASFALISVIGLMILFIKNVPKY